MRKLILATILCVSVSLSTSVYAQRGERQGRMQGYEKLDLTDKQKEQIKAERDDFRAKTQQLKEDKNLTDENRKTKSGELRTAHKENIDKILTPEQKSKMDQFRKDRPQNKKDKRQAYRNDRPGKRGDMQRDKGISGDRQNRDRGSIAKHLDLTDAQKEQIKSINKDYANKEKELKEQRKNDVAKIYTPEQQSKLKQVQTEKIAQRNKVTVEGATKLMASKDSFQKEKRAITMSRIAPDAQKSKLQELEKKHREEIKELKKKYSL